MGNGPFTDGVPKEAGEYDTEELAAVSAHKILLIWEANGYTYGSVYTITSQSNVKVVPDPSEN